MGPSLFLNDLGGLGTPLCALDIGSCEGLDLLPISNPCLRRILPPLPGDEKKLGGSAGLSYCLWSSKPGAHISDSELGSCGAVGGRGGRALGTISIVPAMFT